MKNAEKRRSRLKKRARLLPDLDLAQVISMRAAASGASGESPAKRAARRAEQDEKPPAPPPSPAEDDGSDAAADER